MGALEEIEEFILIHYFVIYPVVGLYLSYLIELLSFMKDMNMKQTDVAGFWTYPVIP